MDNFWSSSNILKIFIKWKWHIITITLLGMIAIGGATYLIKPKYQSYAVVYPVNLGTFSEESFSEQMIQLLQSRDITDKVMRQFDLPKHYGIDSTYKHFMSTMYYLYSENVSISKTEYESVEIKVLDTDPDTASLMVDAILNFYNEKVREMHRLKLKELMVINENQANKWELEKNETIARLKQISQEKGLLDYTTQVTKLTEGIYRSGGNAKMIKKAESQLDNLESYGTEFIFLTQKLEKTMELFFQYSLALEQQKIEYEKIITYAHVVTSSYATDNKYSPKRIPITLLGGISVLLLVMLIIGFVENKKFNL